MKLWQFWLTLATAVGLTYGFPGLLGWFLYEKGMRWPWNAVAVILSMATFAMLLIWLCIREERAVLEARPRK